MPEWASVNGRFSSIDEATVPINDRGLLFADSVYEVFVAYGGRLWLEEEHYRRLAASLNALGITADLRQIRAWVAETVRQSQLGQALVYLQVTRGVAPRGHLPPQDLRPTVIVTARELRTLSAETHERGVPVITTPETRWARRDVKTTNLLANTLAKRAADAAGAFEALFVNPDHTLNEGSSTNFFLVKQGEVITPPKTHAILPGVSRDAVVELARSEGLKVAERPVSRDELLAADEVFLTGTTTEVLGVVSVDGQKIADGRVGPITQRLCAAFERRREAWLAAFQQQQ
ncbi:MAG: aminotransferase class IV [Pirellulales bacterium]|nr:aminotransferase class IV [Pirellulales bacterium]